MRNGGGIGQGRRIELRRDFDAAQLRRVVEALEGLNLCLDLGRQPGFTWLLEPPTCARASMASLVEQQYYFPQNAGSSEAPPILRTRKLKVK